eukprot:6201465-Pleurochrysis_carterae.AAC.7
MFSCLPRTRIGLVHPRSATLYNFPSKNELPESTSDHLVVQAAELQDDALVCAGKGGLRCGSES